MVVVGGGHNGLICAGYLARGGLDVIVLEKNKACGGALFSASRDGFTFEHGAIDHSTIVNSPIPDELSLHRHGLDYIHRTNSAVHVFADGPQIVIAATPEETAASIAAIDGADAEAWLELARVSTALNQLWAQLSTGRAISMHAAIRLGAIAVGRRGRKFVDLARLPVTELADRWFRSPYMRALAVFRSQYSGLPPWAPGTGAVFCLTPGSHGRRFSRPVGGSKAFVAALESSLQTAGGRIRTEFEVSRVVPKQGGGWHIQGRTGESIVASRAVVSAIPPQDMVLLLLDEGVMSHRRRRRFREVEVVSGNLSQFTISAALNRAPDLKRIPEGFAGSQLWMLQDPAAVMDSPVAAASGTLPTRPGVLGTVPSILDPTAAPPGAATLWINGFITHRFNEPGGWAGQAQVATERIWSTVDSCLPGLSGLVSEQIFTSPDDLTRWTGAANPGGHIALTLNQLTSKRPVRGCADHRSGVEGLYFTGAGTNPGPSISGLPGRACAQAVLADLGSNSRTSRGVAAQAEITRLRRTLHIVGELRSLSRAESPAVRRV